MNTSLNIFFLIVLFTICYCARGPQNCDELLQKNGKAASGKHTFNLDNGKTETFYCDMETACGGWTKIDHIKFQGRGTHGTFNIDDKGLSYREVRIKTTPQHYLSYVASGDAWWSTGFSLAQNYLKFDNNYFYYQFSGTWRGCGGRGGAPYEVIVGNWWYITKYIRPEDYTILKRSSGTCKINNRASNLCVEDFILQAPGRLNGLGDLEGVTNQCEGDNRRNYDIEIYVR